MRVSRKTLIVTAATALIALGATAVYAGPWFGGKKSERIKTFVQWKVDDGLDLLEATDGQRAQITPLVDQIVDSAFARVGDREAFREEMLSLWQAPKADVEAARDRIFDRVENIRALGHEAIDAAAAVHGILTPEQRKLMAEKVEERARDRQRTPAERAERAERFAGFIVEEVADEVEATQAQSAELQRLAAGLVKTGLAQMSDHSAMRAEVLALWNAPQADAKAAKAMFDARVDVWKQLAVEAINTAAGAHATLDAGQRDAVADAVRKRARRWH